MNFKKNSVFHIYNQGNNNQQIFFKEDDYLDFIKRMRRYLVPHVEFLAYCLMPNHFHFLVYVKLIEVDFPIVRKLPDGKERVTKISNRSLNFSIGLMLRSYSSHINHERGTCGSLFRQKTKAKEDFIHDFITVNHSQFDGRNNYGLNCFYYIHDNPLEAKLVSDLKNWPYSSYLDYSGQRNGTLCNYELAKVYFGRSKFY